MPHFHQGVIYIYLSPSHAAKVAIPFLYRRLLLDSEGIEPRELIPWIKREMLDIFARKISSTEMAIPMSTLSRHVKLRILGPPTNGLESMRQTRFPFWPLKSKSRHQDACRFPIQMSRKQSSATKLAIQREVSPSFGNMITKRSYRSKLASHCFLDNSRA